MDLRFYEGTYAANYQTSSTLKNGYIELTAPNSNNTGVISTKVAYDLDLSWLARKWKCCIRTTT